MRYLMPERYLNTFIHLILHEIDVLEKSDRLRATQEGEG